MFPNPVICDIMVNQTMANEIEMINRFVPNNQIDLFINLKILFEIPLLSLISNVSSSYCSVIIWGYNDIEFLNAHCEWAIKDVVQ